MVTLLDVRDYLGIDWADEATDRRLNHLILTADKIVQGSVGVNYPIDDPRAKELSLIIISDLYDSQTLSDKVIANIQRKSDLLGLQLRLELRVDEV